MYYLYILSYILFNINYLIKKIDWFFFIFYIIGPWNCVEHKEQYNIIANVSDIWIMQEVLQKMYGCTLIQIQNGLVISILPGISTEVHCNLLPILFAIETTSAFLTLHEQTAQYSLRE